MRFRFHIFLVLCFLVAGGVAADPPKEGRTCGCQADTYATYGAGIETCGVFSREYAQNPDPDDVNASYGQSLGWIAGYMSATNHVMKKRDLYDLDLSYVAYKVAQWCGDNPDQTLSDAMESLTEERRNRKNLLPAE